VTTFVLLHGGAHGGWCYRSVARELRDRGHEVYAPTLSGFAERGHVDASSVTMEDHISEVADLVTYEDLDNVVLVGHSLGGVVLPGVAARVRERVRRVVWLAAIVLANGESVATHYLTPSETIARAVATGDEALFVEAFVHDGTPAQQAWVRERLGPSTMATINHVGDLDGFLDLGLATGYVTALRDRALPRELTDRFAARLRNSRRREVDAGHDLMITKPHETADALEAMLA
jgi:pimeloyl-ACP methyl ester carboxylesterase